MDLLDAPTRAPASAEPPPEGRQRRAGGRRSTRMAERRALERRARTHLLRRRMAVVGAAVLAVTAVTALLAWTLARGDDAPTAGDADAPAGVPVDQQTLLLLREEPDTRGAAGATLLATSGGGAPSATFIPSTTLVEVPGVGMDRLGLAHHYGGAALTLATVENALGIQIDRAVTVTQDDLGAFLQRAGGAEIDISDRLVDRAADGTGTVAFDAGPQYLNGLRLAEYWGFEQRGESELDSFPRQQRALAAMLTALADEELRDRLLAEVPPELATDADASFLRSVIAPLAEAASSGVLQYQLLPVAPFGSTDESMGASYQLRSDEVAELVATTLAGSVPEGAAAGVLRLQVLNGVGVPGVGQQVDEAVEGLGVRITLSENARSFDFTQTQIVVYDESPERLQAAERVREAMGVGTILVSRQPQSVVDMTIVVGADFLASSRLGAGPPASAGP